MRIYWVSNISYFIGLTIQTLKQKAHPSPGTQEQWAGDKIPEKWVGCNLSQLCGSTRTLPTSPVLRSAGQGVSTLRQKTNITGSPGGSASSEVAAPRVSWAEQFRRKARPKCTTWDTEEVKRVLLSNRSVGMAAEQRERRDSYAPAILPLRWALRPGEWG